MTWLGSTDPGACSGWALSFNAEIAAAGVVALGSEPWPFGPLLQDTRWILETMQADARGAGSLKKQQDNLECQLSAGEWKGRLIVLGVQKILEVLPREWKGTIDKEVHHRIIRKTLTARELSYLPAGSWDLDKGRAPGKWHNMWDAIGLNLFGSGRLGRAGKAVT